jgi:serine/threonine-protein kinase/endoribonuclease IRE1
VKKFGERARKLIKWTALSRTLYFYHKDFDPKISDTSEGHTSLENFINKMGKYLKNEELLELVKQVTKGLKVLHSYEMFHSEINPKNIEVCVSQTNKGKVYKIENIESYQNEVRCWKSPESLNSGLKGSYEDDIFSLGCIIYFIVSEGKHPFNFQQSNILTYKPELSALKNCQNRDKNGFYINLIKEMIKADHKERPTIDEVSNHPLFWDTDKLMNFFRKVTNFIRKYENQALDGSINISSSQQEIEVVITNLTKKRNEIYKKDNWFEELCPTVQNFEIKRIESKDEKEKKFRLCKDRASLKKLIELHRLIHYIVDKERHLREWPIEIKEGEHFLDYFTERFPNLLICSYDCFKILKDESLLKSFY